MPSSYEILKFVHVLLAIIAVGANATYGVWFARVRREPENTLHVLRTLKRVDDLMANPAYGLLLVTGLLMVWVGGIPWSTSWIHWGLGLFALLLVFGFMFSPLLRKQIRVCEAEGPDSPALAALSKRGAILGVILGILAVAIVYVMVVKPG